ncbi:carbohydrate kinase family protein [Streptomyces sp. NPDC060048]|uniref:carbohydrate kinase family protein n=1 Tax=unclassified Streptomyces TaxID=2593676 RepID=UPI0036B46158
MKIALTGSIAVDHLMSFPGRFADQMILDRMDKVSLSFLADRLEIRRGGVAANIAFGLGSLGLHPVLVGAVGPDYGPEAERLVSFGVDTESVLVSEELHTARFVCTTDDDHNQIATFYAGAMSEARRIELAPVARRVGGLDLVVVSPNDPAAMLRHTDESRTLGIPFAADPSQQLARLEPAEVRSLVGGARYLFTNEYESALLQEKTGWTTGQVLARVGSWITTLGADGARIAREDESTLRVPAVPTTAAVEPTGAGDAFRAGFLAGTVWGWSPEGAARLGCALATVVLETVGTQEYETSRGALLEQVGATYATADSAAGVS